MKNDWNFLNLSFSDPVRKIMSSGVRKMGHSHAKEWNWTLSCTKVNENQL